MSAIAVFDYATWVARYPELANTQAPLATLYFAEAGLYWNNTGWRGRVSDPNQQLMLMNMLTAHIAYLNNGDINGPAPSGAVAGHMDSANQGSIAIQASIASNVPLTAAFFTQTRYGLAFWQAVAQYRTARYRPSYRSPLVGNPYGGGFGGRGFI
jgi:hypothetical protein